MTDIWTPTTLTNGPLKLDILAGIGGRLWDVTFQGQSLLFQNPDLIGIKPDIQTPSNMPSRSTHLGFPLWGGEKTWIAPESDWGKNGPYPVLDSGAYAVVQASDTHVELQSDICLETGLKIRRTIRILSDQSWSIEHRLTNCAKTPRLAGIWSVMMLKRPATIGLQKGPGRMLPVFGDAGECVRINAHFACVNCETHRAFKVAFQNQSGRVFIRNTQDENPLWITAITAPFDADETYAHSYDFEVFNSNDYPYLEAEWHSPSRQLAPDETLSLSQVFHIQTEKDLFSNGDTTLNKAELFACML